MGLRAGRLVDRPAVVQDSKQPSCGEVLVRRHEMRRVVGSLLVCGLFHGVAWAKKVDEQCTFEGKKLAGKVEIVEAFGDFKVEVVTAFPDLKVQKVSAFADDCGEWEIVDAFGDFKVEIVDAFGDFKIQYVDAFPGVP